MSVSSFFKSAWTDIVKAEHAVIGALQKAAGAVPEVESVIEQYGSEIGQIATMIVPSAGQYTNVAIQSAMIIGQAIEDGGTAAENAFLKMGADQTFINDIKSLWANLKTAAKSSAASGSAPAPAPAPARAQ